MSADDVYPDIKSKIKRILNNVRKVWWVLLIIIAYMVVGNLFLGSGCLPYSIIGIPCPGCGATRSVAALIRGDVVASLRLYPMLVPAIVFFTAYAAMSLFCERKPRYLDRAAQIFAVLLVLVYIARMVLMFPDNPPMVINRQAMLMRVLGALRGW